jgi:aspartyl-tRNA(Asn)/glutamyl-tRNA(Gln) amidotransferase subunit A
MLNLSAFEISRNIRAKNCSAVEITRTYLEAIDHGNQRINAYLTVCSEAALSRAQAIDREISAGGDPGPLAGVPVAVKDLISTRGVRTTCASRILENYVPVYNATVVEKLQDAGAIIIGKTNMDEFGMGSTTENSYFGAARNPHNPEYIAGGSSGGSAAAVSARLASAALGSDTGGSIRQPAACCGVVGLKPTYSRVSRYGLLAYASSLDQIGPLSRNVRDAALMLQTIAGHDPNDSTSSEKPVPDYLASLDGGVRGLRLGLPREYFGEGLSAPVKQAIMDLAHRLEKAGAILTDISLSSTPFAIATYYIIATAEASSNLARYDGVKYGFREPGARDLHELYTASRSQGFGPEVKRRIMLGTYVLSAGYYDAYYAQAQRVRTLLVNDFNQAFTRCDALLTPVMPTTAYKIGEKVDDPLAMYLLDIYTVSVNLAGLPGLVIPCGEHQGLPIGAQLIGPGFGEETLFRIGSAAEKLN